MANWHSVCLQPAPTCPAFLQAGQELTLPVRFLLLSLIVALVGLNREGIEPKLELISSSCHHLWFHLLLPSLPSALSAPMNTGCIRQHRFISLSVMKLIELECFCPCPVWISFTILSISRFCAQKLAANHWQAELLASPTFSFCRENYCSYE